MGPHPHNRSVQVFTVRIWSEKLSDTNAEWRGRVHHISTDETCYFRDWPALIQFLQRMLSGTENGEP